MAESPQPVVSVERRADGIALVTIENPKLELARTAFTPARPRRFTVSG